MTQEGIAKRTELWFTIVALGIGVVLLGVGVIVTLRSNETPIHPDPVAVPAVIAAAPASGWTAAVEEGQRLARAALVEQNLPGLSVAVGVQGDVVWAEGFGWSNLQTRTPMTPRTRVRIGHVSKALTSAAVGLLRDQGRLHLDDEIQTMVPGFPEKAWPVTLRHLMANTAGVRHYKDDEWGDKPTTRCDRAAEGLASFAAEPLLFEPGTEYRYSTYGWVVVSAAVEARAGEPFFRFMANRVFGPFGMRDTTEDVVGVPMSDRSTSYYRSNFNQEVTTNVDYSCFAGGGAFLSTPTDLVRFGQALQHGALLQPATVGVLQAPQTIASGELTSYGLGWMLETVDLPSGRTRIAGHASRTLEGASTSFLTFPERDLVVAVSSNISFADMKSVALAVARLFEAGESSPLR